MSQMIARASRGLRARNHVAACSLCRAAVSNSGSRRSLATIASGKSSSPASAHPSRMPPYAKLLEQLAIVRALLDRPLTLSEKILYSHIRNPEEALSHIGRDTSNIRGKEYLKLTIDRLAMQDASAQMALLQFMTCGLPRTAIPSSVHCDHLIQAYEGAEADLKRSIASNSEVFDFLRSASQKYGIEFWGPGSGIIHQIVLENYAAPGMLMLGTDSHTPNASGMGCLAIGVGGADAVDAMTNTPWELLAPKVLGVKLTGKLNGWCTPKDVILHLAGKLTVRGGTGKIIEYSGSGLDSISATGLATMSNMGAEVGATTSAFPYSAEMGKYLRATGREQVAQQAQAAFDQGLLRADQGAQYDEEVHIDLSKLEPTLNGPFTPDLSTPLSTFVERAKSDARDHPIELSAALIGSCTNSSYADMARCASLAKQAKERGMKVVTSFDVTPGSEQVRATIERDGIEQDLLDVGARVLANACGPCIGQWNRKELQGKSNVILTSFNRNFRGRNDGNSKTMNMLASPEIVTAMAFAGRLDFNPMTDTLKAPDGSDFKFEPPSGNELPTRGFVPGDTSYLPAAAPEPQPSTEVLISPTSQRLEPLQPFNSPFASRADFELPSMRCLLRIRGKCTTDHISAAGPWLKYKGHLSNLAENTLIGAMNDENGEVNSARDFEAAAGDKEQEWDTIPSMAKRFRARGQPWMIVADHNYGEGSAREHAALQPRFYGCNLIVARSIARIAETNLRKQGVLTLLFANEDDYSKIAAGDLVETVNLSELIDPVKGDLGTQVQLRVTKFAEDGKSVREVLHIRTVHTLSKTHLDWIRAGSALNLIRQQAAQSAGSSDSGRGAGSSARVMPVSSGTSSSAARQARAYSTSSVGLQKTAPAVGSAWPSSQRRGYATAPAGKSTASASRLNPNDPNYVPPMADSRTEAIRKMVFPPAPAAAAVSAADVLPYGAEVHDTIRRAYLLLRRTERESQREDLRNKHAAMVEALDDLQRTDARLYAAATLRVASSKRTQDEMRRLRQLGLTAAGGIRPDAGGEGKGGERSALLASPEARRRLKNEGSKRLSGLFPREWRAPTLTPSSKGWPSYGGGASV
ncbi:aconitate hydratase [Tilletiaria anomala UBC 951]|uniref:Aconitate hydratase n=1 Tax=Tilletiaria anomala (strain ATCC 24038 / CBS 436.72 / UBC 951) TaxID=1037660 RepID=A0A066W1F1_TILAU|nr:aconitate hydratase [Tilletiaria anomala UBC 951]KDN47571.1 aconitate hydratase [Tilletiaria anomala UBC 951]